LILKSLISSAESKNSPARFTWNELNQKVPNLEHPLDYYTFLSYHDKNPAVQMLTKHFDENGLELKTKDSVEIQRNQQDQTVKKMAMRATDKARG
jgi:hypothetical protein